MDPRKGKAARDCAQAAFDNTATHHPDNTPTIVSGQCAEVLELIRQNQPILSFTLTADHAIPETAARVHDLRAMGFNIITTIHSEIDFRGRIRRNVASYSLGSPEWTQPVTKAAPDPGKALAFFEAAEKCTKQCADQIADRLTSLPEDEKQTARRAVCRDLRSFLQMSNARQCCGSSGV